VRAFAEALPERVLLILDEAYYEFVEDPAYAGSHELVLGSTHVVASRTFSKVHGLAGLRVGYGIASRELATYAWRAHVPFSVSLVAQAAAEASMRQTESIAERARFVTGERGRLQGAFDAAGLEYVPSHTNFILVRTGPAVFERTGVLVREGEALGLPGVEPNLYREPRGERPDHSRALPGEINAGTMTTSLRQGGLGSLESVSGQPGRSVS
jgi:histidinol-phosphate aminotransferase